MILTPATPAWWHVDDPELGLMNVVSRSIADFEGKYHGGLPDMRDTAKLLVASDYGGSHREAPYETMSLLITDAPSVDEWQTRRHHLRATYLPDGRRLSYKGLNDAKKRTAVLPFLRAANGLRGLVLAVLFDKRLESLFQTEGKLRSDDPELVEFAAWKPSTVERMLRYIHFVSLVLRGLSAPDQDVLWISDQDEVVANEMRLRQVVMAFGNVLSHYVPHNLGHIRLGTTASDTGARDVEDLVSIPDLVAGASTDVIPGLVSRGGLSAGRIMIPAYPGIKTKARDLMDWFSDNSHPLRRVVCILDEGKERSKCRVTCVRFHGSSDIDI